MTIPPETLKSIAEAMGYEYEGTHENGNVWCSKKGIVSKYNPPNNPAQLLELVECLLKKKWVIAYDYICNHYEWSKEFKRSMSVEFAMNMSFSHAVMEAVIKELGL